MCDNKIEDKIKGYVNSVESMGLVDGPGVRAVVFMQGCSLRCKYCHNPETWKIHDSAFSDSVFYMEYEPEALAEKLMRYKPYMKHGGVTFSGGEPLLQAEFVLRTVKLLKEKGNLHVCLDTAGVTGHTSYESLVSDSSITELIRLTDLVILDIKAYDAAGYKYITGRSMDSFLHFLKLVQDMEKRLWLRSVIVPGINSDAESIRRLRAFMSEIKNVEKTELIPYHTLGVPKYKKLGIEYPLEGVPDMTITDMS